MDDQLYANLNKIHASNPGKVAENPLLIYLGAFSDNQEVIKDYKKRYLTGQQVGDVKSKRFLASEINRALASLYEQHARFASQPQDAADLLQQGAPKAGLTANETYIQAMGAQ